jgi:hypothetical protein
VYEVCVFNLINLQIAVKINKHVFLINFFMDTFIYMSTVANTSHLRKNHHYYEKFYLALFFSQNNEQFVFNVQKQYIVHHEVFDISDDDFSLTNSQLMKYLYIVCSATLLYITFAH